MNLLVKKNKGQNVVEYLLLTVGVVLVLLVFMNPRGNGGIMKNAMENSLGSTVDKIDMLGQEIKYNYSAN